MPLGHKIQSALGNRFSLVSSLSLILFVVLPGYAHFELYGE